MIGSTVKKYLLENEDNFLIDAKNVATMMDTNTLEHALLVLSNIGYSRIPVVNKEQQLVGLISLSQVVEQIFDIDSLNTEKLADMSVSQVMDTNTDAIKIPYSIEKIMHLLVDSNFVPIVDENEVFLGIVTRRELLKSVNRLAHEIENDYDFIKK